MRNLIAAILCLGILLGIWGFYHDYSGHKLENYRKALQTRVISTMERKNWEEAYKNFCEIEKDWSAYATHANFFFDNQMLSNVSSSFAKAKYYIKAKDDSNAPGEIASLNAQLNYLHESEELSLGNVL